MSKRMSAWMDAEPTSVLMAVDFVANGGDVRTDSVQRIYGKVLKAFNDAADAEGLSHTWTIACRSTSPARFNKRLIREGLDLDRPTSQEPGGHQP